MSIVASVPALFCNIIVDVVRRALALQLCLFGLDLCWWIWAWSLVVAHHQCPIILLDIVGGLPPSCQLMGTGPPGL